MSQAKLASFLIRSIPIILFGTFLAIGNANALVQRFTEDQLLRMISESVKHRIDDSDITEATEPLAKSLANGLYMQGTGTYSYVGNTASLTIARINNDSYSRTSGTLRLELWATPARPARGDGFSGYKLATSSQLNPLPPRSYYSSVTRTTGMSVPPDGTYWMVLVLSEYDSTACFSNGNYCLTDSLVFSTQRTFGTPSSTVTVVATSGICVENVPSDVATGLMQSQPGVWTTYPASRTCSSLGFPFFAGNLTDAQDLRVYTSSSSAAQQVCATGLVVNCTAYPAPSANYTDLWWNPSESGWGVSFTQHSSGLAFVAWYTYDASGNPKWYVASSCRVVGSGCTGALYETTGPPFGSPFNPSRVSVMEVGSVTFAFSGESQGTMSYIVHGVPGTKQITRQPF